MLPVNREYKDRLFKFIFGNPEHKDWTLSLYNAVNGTSYEDPSKIELTTIEDVVYMGMKNDVSFLVSDVMSMYEQQSTYNPNMPMRFLIYAGMLYGRYVETNPSYHRYSTRQQTAPMPKCVCFYNGTAGKDDNADLYLRDAFPGEGDPDIEVHVAMVNINHGHSRRIMERCEPLYEYAWFVDRVRKREGAGEMSDLKAAVSKALDEMPDDFVIKPFLMANRAAVTHMCMTEYDEARTLAELREEERQEGYDEGRKDGYDEGRAEEREVINKENAMLARALTEAGRLEDLGEAMMDPSVRERLLEEFGIAAGSEA